MKLRCRLGLFLLSGAIIFLAQTESYAESSAVLFKEVYGAVKRIEAEGQRIEIAQPGDAINENDKVVTLKGGSAVIQAGEDAEIELRENTTWQLQSNEEGATAGSISSELLIGELQAKIQRMKQDALFEIKTPTSVAVVRGTEFQLRVYEINGEVYTHVYVSGGIVVFSDLARDNVRQIDAGQSAVSLGTKASPEMAARLAAMAAGDEESREDLELTAVIEAGQPKNTSPDESSEAKVDARIS